MKLLTKRHKKEILILVLFVVLTIIFYYFFPIIHCYLIWESGPYHLKCADEEYEKVKDIKIFDVFWDSIPITVFSVFLTFMFLKKKTKIFFIAIILLSIFSYGIPFVENKILWGIEDTQMHFIHSRHVYNYGRFLFDPNDVITKTPDYTQPIFHILSAAFSRTIGIDVIYSWIILCFVSTIVSSLFIYLITKLFTKNSEISFVAAIFAFSISYRTLAWTHPEVLGTTMVLGSLYFILKYVLSRKDIKYLFLCGLFLTVAVLTHFVSGAFAGALVFSISLYYWIKKRDAKIFIPIALGLFLSLPYYYELLTETDFLNSNRNTLIGKNWIPFICTDNRICSPIFMGLITAFVLALIGFIYWYRKNKNYRLILLMVLVSSFLLYHILLYRWGLLPTHTQSHRFSSLTFIVYSIAATFILKDLKRPVKVLFVFLFIFFGLYYSFYEGKDAYWSIRPNSEKFIFFSWVRENIADNARFLVYDTSPPHMTEFYDIAGKNYVLPSTSRKIEGQFWESGFVSLTKNHEYAKNRVNEWLDLDKTNSEDIETFFSKYNVTHVLYSEGKNSEEFEALNQVCTLLKSEAEFHLFSCNP